MITFLWIALALLAMLGLVCIVRSIIGPRNTDRVLGVNMIGSMVNAMIAIIATIYDANYLADVAILYALLSFTAVVVLSRIVRGVDKEMKEAKHD